MGDSKEKTFSQKTGDLPSGIKHIYESSEFSDLTVLTANRGFKVHRLVVCTQSEFFWRMMQNNWKETEDKVISLKEDDPKAVEAMIRFMYGLEYPGKADSKSAMLLQVKVYRLADKYFVPKLKEHAKTQFKSAIEKHWNTKEFPIAVREAYTTTPSGDRDLRDPINNVSRDNVNDLMDNDCFAQLLDYWFRS